MITLETGINQVDAKLESISILPWTGQVFGYVIDSVTGEAINRVNVSVIDADGNQMILLKGHSVNPSQSDGLFIIYNIPCEFERCTYTIRFEKEGYNTKEELFSISRTNPMASMEAIKLEAAICDEGEYWCDAYDHYQCQGNKWVLIESNSPACGYAEESPFTIEGMCFSKIGGPFRQDELTLGTYYPVVKILYEARESWPVTIILDVELIIKGPSNRSNAHLFSLDCALDSGKTMYIAPHTPPNGVGYIANISAMDAGIYTFTTKLHYQDKEILSHTEEVIVGGATEDFSPVEGYLYYNDGVTPIVKGFIGFSSPNFIYTTANSEGLYHFNSIKVGKWNVQMGGPIVCQPTNGGQSCGPLWREDMGTVTIEPFAINEVDFISREHLPE